MRAQKGWPEGRTRPKLPAAHRATKAIAVSPEVWTHINVRRYNGESMDDVLRRLLGLMMRAG